MLMNIEIEHDQQLVILTISGRLVSGELARELSLLLENVELVGYSMLLDLRQAEVVNLSSENSKGLARRPLAPVPPKCIALLVTTDAQRELAQAYVTARYTQKHYSPCRVFTQLDKALVWIKAEGK